MFNTNDKMETPEEMYQSIKRYIEDLSADPDTRDIWRLLNHYRDQAQVLRDDIRAVGIQAIHDAAKIQKSLEATTPDKWST